MLLGQARGKVGSLVFSRSNGKQITRSRAEVVKNPQTRAQMIQRIILASVSQAYSYMSEIADHSFENVPVGQRSMSAFMAANMSKLREAVATAVQSGTTLNDIVAFTPLKTTIFAPNAYILSKGSLPRIDVSQAGIDDKLRANFGDTYGDVINEYGLQRGDQLTFCGIVSIDENTVQFRYARVILDPMNVDGEQLPLTTPFIVDGAINAPNSRNEGSLTFTNGLGEEKNFGFGSYNIYGGTIIVSRKNTDGVWKRSSAELVINETVIIPRYSLQYCLDAISQDGVDALSGLYLNNSGTGRVATEGVSQPFVVDYVRFDNVEVDEGERYNTEAGPSGTTIAVTARLQSYNADRTYKVSIVSGSSTIATANFADGAASLSLDGTEAMTATLVISDNVGNAKTWCTITITD